MTSERIEDALDAFVRSKQKGTDSGNYQRNARRAIEEWVDWLADRKDSIKKFDQLQVSHMRQYARHLKERVDRDELAGSTANTYWNYIAAFLGWCVYEELLAENPVRKRRAEQELPDTRPRSDRQQFWSRADRETLLTHLNERAHTAVDAEGLSAIKELRDRALASLLAYSGVRGAEVLRDPNDERRIGVRWRDVDLEAGTLVGLALAEHDERPGLEVKVTPANPASPFVVGITKDLRTADARVGEQRGERPITEFFDRTQPFFVDGCMGLVR